MRQNRIDFGTLSSVIKTQQGYLKAPCFATRAGIFNYINNDGTIRRELRPPEEVFDSESLKTLSGIPVTLEHPPVMLDANNTAEYAKGYTGDLVEKVDDFVSCGLTVTDINLINSVETNEKRETSCGYSCELEEVSGIWNNQHYDAIQRKIRYNHLAIVAKGRAGSEVKVRLDSCNVQLIEEQIMLKVRIDNQEVELSEVAEKVISEKLKKDSMSLEELSAQLALLQAEIEKLKGEKEGMSLEMDACKKEMDAAIAEKEAQKMDSAKIHSAAMERVTLIKCAEKLIPQVKLDSLSNKEIKVEVIKSKKPDFKADAVSEAFVDGMFDGLTQFENKLDSLGNVINSTKAQAPSLSDARIKSMNADKMAWKN